MVLGVPSPPPLGLLNFLEGFVGWAGLGWVGLGWVGLGWVSSRAPTGSRPDNLVASSPVTGALRALGFTRHEHLTSQQLIELLRYHCVKLPSGSNTLACNQARGCLSKRPVPANSTGGRTGSGPGPVWTPASTSARPISDPAFSNASPSGPLHVFGPAIGVCARVARW